MKLPSVKVQTVSLEVLLEVTQPGVIWGLEGGGQTLLNAESTETAHPSN